MKFPTPHGDKLRALLRNEKLPAEDQPAVEAAIARYDAWILDNQRANIPDEDLIVHLVESLNRYKFALELDLIFDSDNDFLYRQKGQLKLDNTVLEEFLPWLVGRVFERKMGELGLTLGPTNAFSHLRFDGSLLNSPAGGGMIVRSKDHDFALARPLFLKASHRSDYSEAREKKTHLAYMAVELKTNLDKTMFQEASATAYDLKLAIPNSQYFLLCEWLDMPPISTAVTAIKEVIVLRKARRMSSNERAGLSTANGRAAARETFTRRLVENPLSSDAFRRFLSHVDRLLGGDTPEEGEVLSRGWF